MNHPEKIKKLYATDWQIAIDATLRWKDEWGESVVAMVQDRYGDEEGYGYTKQQCMDGG